MTIHNSRQNIWDNIFRHGDNSYTLGIRSVYNQILIQEEEEAKEAEKVKPVI